jgi:hypothetical protein
MNECKIIDSLDACGTKVESPNYFPENIPQRRFINDIDLTRECMHEHFIRQDTKLFDMLLRHIKINEIYKKTQTVNFDVSQYYIK